MIVLVIAIVVILILAGTAVSSLRSSRQRTDIMNFIFDINSMEEKVTNYYVLYGTLPIASNSRVDINNLPVENRTALLSQLSQYDNENYYYIDLSRLGGVSLKEEHRSINGVDNGYIVNEGSLKVYVEKGVRYKLDSETDETIYYTLTPNLVDGQEVYEPKDEEIRIAGYPLTWVTKAELRIILPRQGNETTDWDRWVFKWGFGPKTAEDIARFGTTFHYGDKLIVKSNGTYSIVALEPDSEGSINLASGKYKPTLLNVNITKIDDIPPDFEFKDYGITFIDNETGIKSITYKTLKHYNRNYTEAQEAETDLEARTYGDYFLMDGSGDDVIYQLSSQTIDYCNRLTTILDNWDIEKEDYAEFVANYAGVEVDEELQEKINIRKRNHDDTINTYRNEISYLNSEYSYIYDIHGTTDDSRLVIYVEDYAGNGTVVGVNEFITTKMIADSYNISLDPLEETLARLATYPLIETTGG